MFKKLNFLKYQADCRRQMIVPESCTARELDHIDDLLEQADKVKNQLVRANLRLVVSIAKRHVTAQSDLFEVISDGNISLMRAVARFDYSRGFKFSTYASLGNHA